MYNFEIKKIRIALLENELISFWKPEEFNSVEDAQAYFIKNNVRSHYNGGTWIIAEVTHTEKELKRL